MKLYAWVYSIFFGYLTPAIFNSCKTDTPKQEQQFFYFPKTNIYYDAAEATYIYSLDSGRVWKKLNASVRTDPSPVLGGKIVIAATGEDIWKDNESHRSLYGGMLYNVITRDTSYLLTNTVKSKEEKKPGIKPGSETEKKKNNFIQRIFGKKKNKS